MNNLMEQSLQLFGQSDSFWLPQSASTTAHGVDVTFYFVLYVCIFFFVLNVALLIYFAFKYRRKDGEDPEPSSSHNTPLEVTWTVIPIIIVLVMFWVGFKGYMELRVPPDDAYEIQVTGQKWNWFFTYTQPFNYVATNDLHIPVDRPVKLVMTSEDVIHSMFIPNFRVKQDVVPGRYSTLWFHATELGEYDLFCAEYCGTDHSNMIGTVYVHEAAEFEKWLEDAANYIARIPDNDFIALAEAGKDMYKRKGCMQCHTIDGGVDDGPTFYNIFGKQEQMTDGSTITVDENYIRESILEPQAKIVQGFEPVMPTYQGKLKDKEITAIIEFIKTLKPKDGEGS